ncbi:hypothetical protein [Hymenobacter koreensis]
MSHSIPIYQLQAFSSYNHAPAEVYFPDYAAKEKPKIPLDRPYRGDYYKISLCLRGRAELKVNLASYTVIPGCLVLATPDVIKEWGYLSDDYETLSVFFTREFITTNNAATGKLRFLFRRLLTCCRCCRKRRRALPRPFAFCSRNTTPLTPSGTTS